VIIQTYLLKREFLVFAEGYFVAQRAIKYPSEILKKAPLAQTNCSYLIIYRARRGRGCFYFADIYADIYI